MSAINDNLLFAGINPDEACKHLAGLEAAKHAITPSEVFVALTPAYLQIEPQWSAPTTAFTVAFGVTCCLCFCANDVCD